MVNSHVLHVAIVFFEQTGDRSKLVVNRRQFFFQLADRMRRANAGHHILALGIQQILAVELFLAR